MQVTKDDQSLIVSVCMIVYNHEPYLAQAIEGVLSQDTSFNVKLIIAEDYSTDGSRKIAQVYAENFPDRVVLLTRPHNLGMMPNFIDALQYCDGKYVAICEGDDYWIDPFKLQKQVDFLDKHAEYSICFTRTYEELNGKRIIAPINPWDEEQTFTATDLAVGNIIHTPSVVYRNGLIPTLPVWFNIAPVGDYVLHLLNARKGLIKYIPDITAVYRRFVGVWSSKPMTYQFESFNKVIDLLLTEDFDQSVRTSLIKQKNFYSNELLKLLLRDNDSAFTEKMLAHLRDLNIESEFVIEWMTRVYPEDIRRMQAVWPYRLYRWISLLLGRVRRAMGAGKRAVKVLLLQASR